MLTNDGSHHWVAITYYNSSTLLAAGSNTNVQYNNLGSLAGSGNLTWNDATQTLTVGSIPTLIVSGSTSSLVFNGTETLGYVQNPTPAVPGFEGINESWQMNNTDTTFLDLIYQVYPAFDIAGSVSSGVFQNGETLTQTTSAATATLIGVGLVTAGYLDVVNISGAPNATDIWTGGTSGATFTPTAVPVAEAAAAYYTPIASIPSGELYFYNFLNASNNGEFFIIHAETTPPVGGSYLVVQNAAAVAEGPLVFPYGSASITPELLGTYQFIQYVGTQNPNANAYVTAGGIYVTTADISTDSLSGLVGEQWQVITGNGPQTVNGDIVGLQLLVGHYSTGNVTGKIDPLYVRVQVQYAHTVGDINAIHIDSPLTAYGVTTVTNYRGLYIQDLTDGNISATNTFAIQVGGTAGTSGTGGTASALKQTVVTGLASAIRTVTVNTPATVQDHTIKGNGTLTITLPVTGLFVGQEIWVKNIGTGVVTVTSTGLIDGNANYIISTQWDSAIFQWDGTTWSVF